MKQKFDVAAFVWPAFTGTEPRARIFWPEGIGEWQTVKNVRANSAQKPADYLWDRKPLWGYVDEADPEVMEMEIDCALRHGVNVFIYDWYWYDDRPFLEKCLTEGFLKAKNCDRMGFFLMWANHNADHMWSVELSDELGSEIIWRGDVSPEIFRKLVRYWIEHFFSHPSYYKIEGKPVFMIYMLRTLLKGLGGSDKTREALEYFRDEVKKAGFPGLYLMASYNGFEGLDYNGEYGGKAGDLYELLGFDGISHYNMGTRPQRAGDYEDFIRCHKAEYDRMDQEGKEYFPQVSLGWDNNPRYRKYKKYVTVNNTPENVKKALAQARDYASSHPLPARLVLINSWNEWTETSYLQPDQLNGYGYLEAVRDVFLESEEMNCQTKCNTLQDKDQTNQ